LIRLHRRRYEQSISFSSGFFCIRHLASRVVASLLYTVKFPATDPPFPFSHSLAPRRFFDYVMVLYLARLPVTEMTQLNSAVTWNTRRPDFPPSLRPPGFFFPHELLLTQPLPHQQFFVWKPSSSIYRVARSSVQPFSSLGLESIPRRATLLHGRLSPIFFFIWSRLRAATEQLGSPTAFVPRDSGGGLSFVSTFSHRFHDFLSRSIISAVPVYFLSVAYTKLEANSRFRFLLKLFLKENTAFRRPFPRFFLLPPSSPAPARPLFLVGDLFFSGSLPSSPSPRFADLCVLRQLFQLLLFSFYYFRPPPDLFALIF